MASRVHTSLVLWLFLLLLPHQSGVRASRLLNFKRKYVKDVHLASITEILSKRSSHPLELVHLDLCVPMHATSIGGNGYFLTYIDDYSRKTWIFFLQKNEKFMNILKASRLLWKGKWLPVEDSMYQFRRWICWSWIWSFLEGK